MNLALRRPSPPKPLGWQSVFFVNLSPVLPMLCMSYLVLHGDALSIRKERLVFDWQGLALAVVALGATVCTIGLAINSGAHLVGSVIHANPNELFPTYRDVDSVIVQVNRESVAHINAFVATSPELAD